MIEIAILIAVALLIFFLAFVVVTWIVENLYRAWHNRELVSLWEVAIHLRRYL